MKRFGSVGEIDVERDIWQELAQSDKPIVMYGMGNGADKIIEALSFFGVEVDDFFASDGFVRGQSFHGKVVLSYSQVCEKYGDFNIVVSFGTKLPEVLGNIYRLNQGNLYIPDVPVVCDDLKAELFTLERFERDYEKYARVCDMLADEKSKETFCDIIAYRLTGRLEPLRRHVVTPDEVYNEILHAENFRSAADLGAYNGDSLRELRAYAPNLAEAVALEPDARNFRKLCEYAKTADFGINPINAAAWDEDTELTFTSGGNRNSTLSSDVGLKTGAKLKTVQARRLDSVRTEPVDYVKYDVEGAEYEALNGSRGLLKSHPALLVSLYHRTDDLWRLPELVESLGYERLYLRRYEYVPAWDLNLLAK